MHANATAGLRQGYRFPELRAEELFPWCAAFSASAVSAVSAELHFQISETLSLRPFLPHGDAKANLGREQVVALRNGLAEVYQLALARSFDPARMAPQSADMAAMVDVAGALVLAICASAEPAEAGARDTRKMAALLGAVEDLSEVVAETMRRSRAAAVSVFRTDRDLDLVLVSLNDRVEDGATTGGLRARLGTDLPVLALHETPGGGVWLPDDQDLPFERRGDVGRILMALRDIGIVPEAHDLALIGSPETSLRYAAIPADPAETPGEDMRPDDFAETRLSLSRIVAAPSKEALRELQARIVDAGFPVGYRVALQPLPEDAGNEQDVETLREEIAEREAEIELIRALAAPQMRLLRFSDAQLPALVDGLRRMPVEMLRNAGLRYAAGHSAGRPDPVLAGSACGASDGARRSERDGLYTARPAPFACPRQFRWRIVPDPQADPRQPVRRCLRRAGRGRCPAGLPLFAANPVGGRSGCRIAGPPMVPPGDIEPAVDQ